MIDRHDSELLTEEIRCLKYGRIKKVESGEKRMSKTKVSRAAGSNRRPVTMNVSRLGDVEFSWNHN